jgi:hypothetical protein
LTNFSVTDILLPICLVIRRMIETAGYLLFTH